MCDSGVELIVRKTTVSRIVQQDMVIVKKMKLKRLIGGQMIIQKSELMKFRSL